LPDSEIELMRGRIGMGIITGMVMGLLIGVMGTLGALGMDWTQKINLDQAQATIEKQRQDIDFWAGEATRYEVMATECQDSVTKLSETCASMHESTQRDRRSIRCLMYHVMAPEARAQWGLDEQYAKFHCTETDFENWELDE
jgi:uncharacterized membrane-anchored protein YhcB (DUF1043 family)